MDKYFVYTRKSQEDEDRQILSIDSQLNETTKLKEDHGLEVLEVFSESQSAKAPGRPIFNEMINRIYNGEAKGIICWKLDRLARNPVDGGSIIWAVNHFGIEIVTPGKTYGINDLILMYIEFGMANQFINDLSKNTKRGLRAKAEQGWYPGVAKFGYLNDKYKEKGGKSIYKDPVNFPIARKMWDLMLTGAYTPPEILRTANEKLGARTVKRKKIGGNPLTRSFIYNFFTDPFYYGEYQWLDENRIMVWHKGKHEPMITKEEYDRVQALLGRKGRPRPKTHEFAYTGIIRCGECGAMVTAEEKINRYGYRYVYYHCTKRKDPNCTQGSIELKKLEEQIDERLKGIQISEDFKNWAIEELNKENDIEVSNRNSGLESLRQAHKDCLSRLDNLLRLKISPQNVKGELLSDEEYSKQKTELLKEKASLEERLQDTNQRAENWLQKAEATFDFARNARYWFANGDLRKKRIILQGLGSNFLLKDKKLNLELQRPYTIIGNAIKLTPEIEEGSNQKIDYYLKQNPALESKWLPG